MSQETEKYQKIVQWLLNNVNPEIFEIQAIISRIANSMGLPSKPPNSKTPTNLMEVLEEVEETEKRAVGLCLQIVKSWDPPKKKTQPPLNPSEKFEQLFARVLPRIDNSLTEIEEIVFTINENLASITLEPIPEPANNQTALQRQVRFVDKAKRIRSNMGLLEESLSMKEISPAQNMQQQIEFLYSPPVWSTPPIMRFYFEVKESDVLLNKIAINIKGHYLIGRLPVCDIVIDDVTCSRQHAVVQFRPGDPDPETGERKDEVYIYDLGSTSGSYVNSMALQPKAYYPLYPGDVLQFGQYSSSFILRDGTEQVSTFDFQSKLALSKGSVTTSSSVNQTSMPVSSKLNQSQDDDLDQLANASKSINSNLAPQNASNVPVKNANSIIHKDTIREEKKDKPTDAVPLSSFFNQGGESANRLTVSVTSKYEATVPVEKKAESSNKPSSSVIDKPISLSSGLEPKAVEPPTIVEVKKEKASPVDPRSSDFDESDYKRKMLEAYEKQQRENAEILRQRKEREALGLPPIIEIPYVPERPRSQTSANNSKGSSDKDKKKKKGWFSKLRK